MEALERSNLVLAKILDLARANGICQWSLYFADLGLDQQFENHFFPCAEWLEQEGLIRVAEYVHLVGGAANGSIENISLTAKGMALLGQKIEIGGQETTVAKQVEGRANGTISASGIGDFFGGILGGFTKSIGS